MIKALNRRKVSSQRIYYVSARKEEGATCKENKGWGIKRVDVTLFLPSMSDSLFLSSSIFRMALNSAPFSKIVFKRLFVKNFNLFAWLELCWMEFIAYYCYSYSRSGFVRCYMLSVEND